jgi:glycosyltransferase involved in cell wall biosynthesis
MISFIVIGRNEEKNLFTCIESIFNAIKHNNILHYEVIYVDSNSKDDSINIAQRFNEVKIFRIIGECNAAIGRNIGAKESTGDILYFIDGDMEISKEFLALVLNNKQHLKFDFVTGETVDVIDGTIHQARTSNKTLPGGIFLINRKIWIMAEGMKTRFKTGEDLDLGLRLYKLGFSLVMKKELITYHHTKPYLDNTKIWKMLWDKSFFYSRSVLYRDHILNKKMYHGLWLTDKSFIVLLLSITGVLVFPTKLTFFMCVYLCAVILRSIKQKKVSSIPKFVCFFLVFDMLNLVYLLTFFPKSKTLNYVSVVRTNIQFADNVCEEL